MSDENNNQAIEGLSQDEWWLILFSLITDLPSEEWDEFANDLIYRNRFYSTHKVVDVIKQLAEKCTSKMKKGQVLYRARIYHDDSLRHFISDVLKDTYKQKSLDNKQKVVEYYNMQLAAILLAVEKGSPRGKEIVDAYTKWQRKRFKGYDSYGSAAPPPDKTSAGRLNPEKIRYLYLAEDCLTAAYEVRPIIGQNVSVATFKTIDELSIYDLAKEISPQEGENKEGDYLLFGEIQRRFSEPNAGDYYKYLPTQYLGEQIKQMGFDGIRYKSSLKNGGFNVVLFDEKKCKPLCSDVIKVSDIKLEFNPSDLHQLKDYLKPNKNL